jgi:branched-chain amino acid transport system substrate-binding protein
MAAVKTSLGWRGVLGICAAVAVSLFVKPGLAQRAEPCIGAMTRPLANTGASLRIAVETALDQINAAGGVLGKPIRLVIYDDVGEPARAVDNARGIGERDNCVIMMGGGRTPNAIALREPLAEMGLPWMGVISAGTTVIEHQNGKNEWMFRISMKDRWVTGYLIDQAKRRSASGRIGMVYEGTAWGQGAVPDLEAAAKSAGVTIVAKETWNLGDQDMSAQMIRLRDAGVDTIILWAVDRESANMLRSMDRIGYRPKIVSAWGLTTAKGPGSLRRDEGEIPGPHPQHDGPRSAVRHGQRLGRNLRDRRGLEARWRLRPCEAARRIVPRDLRRHRRHLQSGLCAR